MKTLIVAALGALALSVSGAESLWFDTGIKNYSDWPVSGTKAIEGVGVWKGTTHATLVGESGARSLEIDTPAFPKGLDFEAEVQQPVSEDMVVLQTKVEMSCFGLVDDLELPDVWTKCALTAASETKGGAGSFYGLAKDPDGSANAWLRLDGDFAPATGTVFEVLFEIKKVDGKRMVRYTVGGQVMTSGGEEWLETAYEEDARVASVQYTGIGGVSELTGLTEGEVAQTLLTIDPTELEHMTVKSVKVNGVKVKKMETETEEPYVYSVPSNALVVVTFEPEDGYSLNSTTMKFKAEGAEMTLPAEGRPGAVATADFISINEIMASNGDSIRTQAGGKGLDWVEIYNSGDMDIDLTGYYLHDTPDDKKKKWTKIEGSCIVPAKGYKIIWCDKIYDGFTEDEAYARLGLSGNGEPLFLATPEGTVLKRVDFPNQMKGVSYGVCKVERQLLAENAAAEYQVNGGAWNQVQGAIGMSSAQGGIKLTSYKSQVTLNNLATVKEVLDTPGYQDREPITDYVNEIALSDGGGKSWNFGTYPTMPGGVGNVILIFEGVIDVPRGGLWTFCVASDDGFELTLENDEHLYTMECENARAYEPSLSAFNMPAGAYNMKLVYFDKSGDAVVDMSVAEGDKSSAFSKDFKLIGADDCPVKLGGAFSAFLKKDLTSELKGRYKTFNWRSSFNLDEAPSADDVVRLNLRYADGFTAAVNGHQIASVAANGPRSVLETLTDASYEIDPAFLVQGDNVLTITAENDDVNDGEMFLSAQVSMVRGWENLAYFRDPTPGAANSSNGLGPMTPAVTFVEPHGYKTAPFALNLRCDDMPYAPIYYTTDGTSPTESSTLYDPNHPVTISKTTCVRAAVFQEDSILQVDSAATYIFLDDVLANQVPGVTPTDFPADGSVNDHAMRYGLSPTLVADAEARRRILDGFTNSIATLSVVIDPDGLFDESSGIYVNPSCEGRAWERKMMLEQIDPVNGAVNEFSVPAGIRIRGAGSRKSTFAKHALRLFFRGEYGKSSLDFPLFGEEGKSSFDKVDLRCSQNFSVANFNDRNDTFIHEVFSRDSQGAMGEPYTRSRYYNLFINGQYWGLYQTQERGDEDFAEEYNGGTADEYDIIKTTQPGYQTVPTAGDDVAWKTLWELIVNTPNGGEVNFYRVMGLNDDGTRNPEYPVLLNPTNLIAFVLNFHYTCDIDSPTSLGGFPNNLYAIRYREDGVSKRDGFIYLRHDSEWSLGMGIDGNSWETDMTKFGTDYEGGSYFGPHGTYWNPDTHNYDMTAYDRCFGPPEIFWRLTKHPAFREMVANLYYKFFIKDGGAMTVPVAKARFRSRMNEIDSAIVCEYARWSQDPNTPFTYVDWMNACNRCLEFIEKREPYMRRHYQAQGWYPNTEPAVAYDANNAVLKDGVALAPGAGVTLKSETTAGTIYYTLDGSDPRGANGQPSASAVVYSGAIPMPVEGLKITTRVLKSGEWSVSDSVTLVSDLDEAAPEDNLRFAAVMSSAPEGDAGDFITVTNLSGTAVSLVNVKIVAWNAKKKKEADASLVKNLTKYGRILPHGTLTLDAEAIGANDRLTDSDVGLKIYHVLDDGSTNLVQEAFVSTDWFGGVCDEQGGYFIARTFGPTAKTIDDWKPSVESPTEFPPAVENLMRTNAAVKAWIEALCNDAEKEQAVLNYAGDEATLMKCYLIDVTPEAEPEIEIGIPTISVGADGSVRVGGSLFIHETEQKDKTVNGEIRLYHATTLEALPTSKSYLGFGHLFPIVERLVEGVTDAPSRFFRLKVE